MLRRDLGQLGTDNARAELTRVLDDALFLEDGDARDDGCACERMARVRETAWKHAVPERVRDRALDDHAADRDVAGVRALGERDEVGRHLPAVDREPLAAAPEARH